MLRIINQNFVWNIIWSYARLDGQRSLINKKVMGIPIRNTWVYIRFIILLKWVDECAHPTKPTPFDKQFLHIFNYLVKHQHRITFENDFLYLCHLTKVERGN